jgi:ATP-dependent exoDNAse (exonuclease V) beta subunit
MLANREQWIGHLLSARTTGGFDRDRLEQSLRFLIEIQLVKASQITPPDLLAGLPRLCRYAISNTANNQEALEALLENCTGPGRDFLELSAAAESLDHWKTMIDTLLTQAGTMRKSPGVNDGFPPPSKARGEDKERRKAMKDEFQALLSRHSENEALLEVFNTIRTLPSPCFEDEAWQSVESLMRILLQAAQNLKLVMAETGEADFSEIAHKAIEALGFEDTPSELALKLDYRIQHLLVDEFQDTSYSQVKLLKLLTAGWSDGDGRTLFLVGDPMQSIYRFRKAEVSLFIKAWQGELFENVRLGPLQLSVNFRSTEPVVAWVNEVFPAVMPAQDDPVMGAVSYSEAHTRPGVSGKGRVDVKIFPGRDDEQEAEEVIEVISQCDPDESVAILVRSRNHASTILAQLDRLKTDQPRFRYQAIKFIPLADTVLIRDLVSLTLALTQPADRLAWLATLRAPFVGLDLADLEDRWSKLVGWRWVARPA